MIDIGCHVLENSVFTLKDNKFCFAALYVNLLLSFNFHTLSSALFVQLVVCFKQLFEIINLYRRQTIQNSHLNFYSHTIYY